MKHLLWLSLLLLCSVGCNEPNHQTSTSTISKHMSERSPFIHTVFFYLNDGVTSEEKIDFEKGMQKLGTCSTIANYRIGQPAMTPRDIVDNFYAYAWIVEFDTVEDQDTYQSDPIHLEFIERYKDLWKEVKVYDTIIKDL